MPRRARLGLLLAAAPAVAGSFALMRLAGAPAGALAVQAGAAACAALAQMIPARWSALPAIHRPWLLLLLAASLWLPLAVASGAGPFRWIDVAGLRLYLAPLLLPVLVRLAPAPGPRAPRAAALSLAALALLAQPDAAQATATACAGSVLLWAWRRPAALDAGVVAVLWTCAVAAWSRPDALSPVAHVEGVFLLAADGGLGAWAAAWGVALLPAAALLWLGVTARDRGWLAVAAYYAVLLAHAPLLVTPVPLLGYGAGPILGYAAMAVLAPTATREPRLAHLPSRSGG